LRITFFSSRIAHDTCEHRSGALNHKSKIILILNHKTLSVLFDASLAQYLFNIILAFTNLIISLSLLYEIQVMRLDFWFNILVHKQVLSLDHDFSEWIQFFLDLLFVLCVKCLAYSIFLLSGMVGIIIEKFAAFLLGVTHALVYRALHVWNKRWSIIIFFRLD
jgi:hypothetical protein